MQYFSPALYAPAGRLIIRLPPVKDTVCDRIKRGQSLHTLVQAILYLQKIKREAVRRSPEVGHGLEPEL
jgi:hypothetical protein